MSSYKTYHYDIEYLNKKIYGVFFLPDKNKRYPTVVISHGFGGSYQDNLNYALDLVNQGIACYSFDFCGGSLHSQSSGKTSEMSVLTQLQDLLEIIKAIKKLPFVNQNQIFLLGESQGGLISALAASRLKNEIRGLILLYPAFNIPNNARSEYSDIHLIPQQFGLWGIPLGKCYYEDIYQLNVFESIGNYPGPVKIYHGSHDELVPVEYSKRAIQIYSHADLEIINDVGHGFYGHISKKIGQRIIQFIKKNIIF